MQPAPLPSRANRLLAPSNQAIPFYYVVAFAVAAALVVALFAAFALAQELWRRGSADPGAWLPPPESLLDPFLLVMLGAVVVLSALSLWIVTRYERRLELFAESRARNRAIVDNMLDGAIHIDAAGRIAGMNAAAERLFGYRRAELKGQPVSLLLTASLRERVEAQMREHPELGLPPTLVGRHQVQGRRRDGTTVALSLAVTEVHVGGYLVYTAIVRERAAREPPPAELGAAGAQDAGQALAATPRASGS